MHNSIGSFVFFALIIRRISQNEQKKRWNLNMIEMYEHEKTIQVARYF